jgi:hypothetical protein
MVRAGGVADVLHRPVPRTSPRVLGTGHGAGCAPHWHGRVAPHASRRAAARRAARGLRRRRPLSRLALRLPHDPALATEQHAYALRPARIELRRAPNTASHGAVRPLSDRRHIHEADRPLRGRSMPGLGGDGKTANRAGRYGRARGDRRGPARGAADGDRGRVLDQRRLRKRRRLRSRRSGPLPGELPRYSLGRRRPGARRNLALDPRRPPFTLGVCAWGRACRMPARRPLGSW